MTRISLLVKKFLLKSVPASARFGGKQGFHFSRGVFISEQEEKIRKAFKELEDSFMYLGVLKKMALPMAMMLMESKYDNALKIFEIAWDGQLFPSHEELFSTLDEDYDELTKMANAADVIHPISDQMKVVFDNLEKMRDGGMSWEEGKEKLSELFRNRG